MDWIARQLANPSPVLILVFTLFIFATAFSPKFRSVVNQSRLASRSGIRIVDEVRDPSEFSAKYLEIVEHVRESSMGFYFGPRRRPYAPSPPIPSTWVPRWAVSPCSILGALTCFIILTCIVLSPAVVSL